MTMPMGRPLEHSQLVEPRKASVPGGDLELLDLMQGGRRCRYIWICAGGVVSSGVEVDVVPDISRRLVHRNGNGDSLLADEFE